MPNRNNLRVCCIAGFQTRKPNGPSSVLKSPRAADLEIGDTARYNRFGNLRYVRLVLTDPDPDAFRVGTGAIGGSDTSAPGGFVGNVAGLRLERRRAGHLAVRQSPVLHPQSDEHLPTLREANRNGNSSSGSPGRRVAVMDHFPPPWAQTLSR